MSVEKKLLDWQSQIEDAKTKKAQAEGALSNLLEQLKEHGIESFDDLQEAIDAADTEVADLEEKLDKAIKELENKWPQ